MAWIRLHVLSNSIPVHVRVEHISAVATGYEGSAVLDILTDNEPLRVKETVNEVMERILALEA